MRPIPVISGILLTATSILLYYYAPTLIADTARTFVTSISGVNSGNGLSMLRQMGYPPLHVVIPVLQYMLMAVAVAGIGVTTFGLVAKKIPKTKPLKVATDVQLEESNSQTNSKTINGSQANLGNDRVPMEVVNNVLGKLETDLKEIKTGYEDHRQQMENEKKKLERMERDRMAKIISAGEVLIREIPPDKFTERVNHYVELKNKETGQPIDLSLLAEKFSSMKKSLGSAGRSYLTPSEFDDFKKFLD